ncbi:MAG: GEVED domain-containing protein, partial [Acidobacteriota bacterium]
DPADGDDANDLGVAGSTLGSCDGGDDEDGVTFDTMIVACSSNNQVTVASADSGRLDGWIDFNGDGDFADAGEQIFTSQALTGSDTLPFTAPCTTASGDTYARFRVSTAGGLSPAGAAMDGEVEDYAVTTKGVDYGDAPDSYTTSQSSDGPSHAVDPATPLYLGTCVDTEADGQPVTAGSPADGDDVGNGVSVLGSCTGDDDEDGVSFDDMIIACDTSNLTVTASQSGLLDGWIDFNGDGDFGDAGEQILASQALAAGANAVPYVVPCATVTAAITYARFRLSSAGSLAIGGSAMDGEVEDYEVAIKGLDLGDAPEADGYPTLMTSDGARHVVQPADNPTLGAVVDTEADGQPSASHLGDDENGNPDDEDGVSIGAAFVPGGSSVDVTVTTGATGGLVNAWIDWNRDGDWSDAGEQITVDLAVAANTSQVIAVVAPLGSAEGASCARVRIASDGGLLPTGLAMDGEIEDHPVAIASEDPVIGLGKELLAVEELGMGEHAALFEITVFNLGNVKLSNIQVTVDLATAFADAENFALDFATSSNLTINGGFDGDGDILLLAGSDMLDIGESGSIQVQVIVSPGGNAGPYLCSSDATAESPAGTPVADTSQDGGDPDPNGNGDPGDDSDPTEIVFLVDAIEIPTLGGWGLVLLVLLLTTAALRAVRSRHRV